MCTAVSFVDGGLFFGRSLDHTESYDEAVVIAPRHFPLPFRMGKAQASHYAIMGIGCVRDGYPLYYDAVNEAGLAVAGLNFTQSACYGAPEPGCDNVAQFELIPWILGQCGSVAQAKTLLAHTRLVKLDFSPQLGAARLHWLLADSRETVVAEWMADGLHLYSAPEGVLTNEPPFPQQRFHLRDYLGLSVENPENTFAPQLPLRPYSRGQGAMGLPGDLSSQSRFVRAAFVRAHAMAGQEELGQIHRFFRIMDTVQMPLGTCRTETGAWEYTVYTSCYDAAGGICYYTTAQSRRLTAVRLHREKLDGETLMGYPLCSRDQVAEQQIHRNRSPGR